MYRWLDFWLGLGVDGLRLDAVPYLYEREGTMSENLPETHQELKALRAHVDARHDNRMLLAEANQWPEDAVAYFGDGDECHMAFHFPLMPRLFMAIRTESRFSVVDIVEQTPPIPDTCQWAIFLRNHDELTLEMVTDEERDYMYRTYARDRHARLNLGIRRRLAPLLGNNRREIELMNALLFSLPGTPVIYYGDEIGMGDNIYLGDRDGVRTPMQWSFDRNAGFSDANPQQLYLPVIVDPEYHYETVNVEARRANPNSLWWWMKRMIALRTQHPVFGRGSLEFLNPNNPKVLAFLRRHHDETILVVANLSRHSQFVELELSAFTGIHPTELLGRILFPPVGDSGYPLSLGPHDFLWLGLEPAREQITVPAWTEPVEVIEVAGPAGNVFRGSARTRLERLLAAHLPTRVWYVGGDRNIGSVDLLDVVAAERGPEGSRLTLLRVNYLDGEPETYLMPLGLAGGTDAARIESEHPQAVVVRVRHAAGESLLYDATWDAGFSRQLLTAVGSKRRLAGESGTVLTSQTGAFRTGAHFADGQITVTESPEGHSSITYADQWVLKMFRRVGRGINPDLEIRRFLTERTSFTDLPPVAGAFEYRDGGEDPATLAILQGYVPNEGDAWTVLTDSLCGFYEQLLSRFDEFADGAVSREPLADPYEVMPPPEIAELIDGDLQVAEKLGEVTARLHRALASDVEDPEFGPEPFSSLYQRSLYQSIRSSVLSMLREVRARLDGLTGDAGDAVREVVGREGELLEHLNQLLRRPIESAKIRVHGDLRLDQVLSTGKDFVVFDFAGDITRPLSERRLKQSPLSDVARMLRSLHYAAYATLFDLAGSGGTRAHADELAPWALSWYHWTAAAFLRSYLTGTADSGLVAADIALNRPLLEAFFLEQAVRELGWEVRNRPDWVEIPVRGLLHVLETDFEGEAAP